MLQSTTINDHLLYYHLLTENYLKHPHLLMLWWSRYRQPAKFPCCLRRISGDHRVVSRLDSSNSGKANFQKTGLFSSHRSMNDTSTWLNTKLSAGQRLTSYGGYLRYSVLYTARGSGHAIAAPDVIIGSASGAFIVHNSVEQPPSLEVR